MCIKEKERDGCEDNLHFDSRVEWFSYRFCFRMTVFDRYSLVHLKYELVTNLCWFVPRNSVL